MEYYTLSTTTDVLPEPFYGLGSIQNQVMDDKYFVLAYFHYVILGIL